LFVGMGSDIQGDAESQKTFLNKNLSANASGTQAKSWLLHAEGETQQPGESLVPLREEPAFAKTKANLETRQSSLGESMEDLPSTTVTVTAAANKTLLFLHIPKNAGTTVEELGMRAEPSIRWGLYKHTYNGVSFPDQFTLQGGAKCSYWHMPPSQFPDPNPYADPDHEVFCVVRDPWRRLVSEFIYSWSHYRKYIPQHIRRRSCDRSSFNMWLKEMLSKMEKNQTYINNCHMLPQYHFIQGQTGRTWCKHVLRFETLPKDFNQLMKEWNLDIVMGDGTKSNAAKDNVCQELGNSKLENVFSKPVLHRIRKIYATDFQHLGDSLKAK